MQSSQIVESRAVMDFYAAHGIVRFFVGKVDPDKYSVMDLYEDVSLKGEGTGIPQFYHLKWHPPQNEKQLLDLSSDSDYLDMVNAYECEESRVVCVEIVSQSMPSNPQLTLASLRELNKPQNVSERLEEFVATLGTNELSATQLQRFADSFINSQPKSSPNLSPIRPTTEDSPSKGKRRKTVAHKKPPVGRPPKITPRRPFTRSLSSLSPKKTCEASPSTQPSPLTQPSPIHQPSPLSQPSPISHPSPLSQPLSQPSPIHQPFPLSQPSPISHPSALSQPLSQPSPKCQGAALSQQQQTKQTKSQNKDKSKLHSPRKKLPRFSPHFSSKSVPSSSTFHNSPLQYALGLDELVDYDIGEICKEPPKYVDESEDEWVETLPGELPIESSEGDDSEDSDFDEQDLSGGEGSDGDVSLEEEVFSSSDEKVDLEDEVLRRQEFGQDIVEEGEEHLIVNKMASLYKQGKLWKAPKHGSVTLNAGDTFTTKSQLVEVMKDYCIQKGFMWRGIKSAKDRYTQQCSNARCTFRVHCSILVDQITWMVKSIRGSHHSSCTPQESNKNVGSKWVASRLLWLYKLNPEIKVDKMQDHCMQQWGIKVEDHTCYRARKWMKQMVEGKHSEGYQYLPHYCEEFQNRNAGSVCMIKWIDQGPHKAPTFKHLVIVIGPAISSFKRYCRPLIGIDATHLKGPYRGVLLTAMGLDGNNGQFPLAYAVVEKENEEEWSYMLTALVRALDCVGNQSRYTIMSDRHLGIKKAISKVMPTAARRTCVLHYYKNFACQYPGAWFHDFFYMAANAYAPFIFEKVMLKIKDKDASAYHWLRDSEPLDVWARFKFDQSLRCEDNTNNFVESFNHAIVKVRGLPTLTMLEEIRKLIGRRFVKRFERSQNMDGVVVPFVEKKLKQIELDSRSCKKVLFMGQGNFDVKDGDTGFTVRLGDQFCDCRKWQMTGIPCKHALRAIHDRKLDPILHCAPCYSVIDYRSTYDNVIHPIPDPLMWDPKDLPLLDPPKSQIRLGRPPLHKRKDSLTNEAAISNQVHGSATVRCRKCKQMGHNSITCGRPRDVDGRLMGKRKRPPRPTDDQGRPLKRGRPRKVVTESAASTSTQASSFQTAHSETAASSSHEP